MTAPTSVDFTKPGHYPRSGRDLVGGVAYLGRAIDKMRADVNGTVGEYIAACPQSRRVYDLYGVSPEQFRQAVSQNPTDESVLRWLQEHGTKHPSQQEIKQFTQQMLSAGPKDEESLRKRLTDIGQPDRTDVRTYVEIQDLEEEREVPQRGSTTAGAG